MEPSEAGVISPLIGDGEPPAPEPLVLPTSVQREMDETDESLGVLGRPFDRRTPFFVGLTGAFGVAVAYVVVRGIADIASVLIIVGLALFIAIGLNPILEFLTNHSLSRGLAVGIVTSGFVLVIVAFVLAAVPPISHEVHSLITELPALQVGPRVGEGMGRQSGRQAPSHRLPEREVEAEASDSGRDPGGREDSAFVGGGDGGGRRAHHLLPDRPARGETTVVVAHPPQPARARRPP